MSIIKSLIENAFTYQEYRSLTDKLLSEGKTTGDDQSPDRVEYTKLNVARMNRHDKTTVILDELKTKLESLTQKYIWLLITEAWCGDAANAVPVIAKITSASDKIDLKLILRDEHPEVMDMYLTNGARSVPILICLNAETLKEEWHWGPRPAELQKLVYALKAQKDFNIEMLKKEIQLWYLNDKSVSTQKEIAMQIL